MLLGTDIAVAMVLRGDVTVVTFVAAFRGRGGRSQVVRLPQPRLAWNVASLSLVADGWWWWLFAGRVLCLALAASSCLFP